MRTFNYNVLSCFDGNHYVHKIIPKLEQVNQLEIEIGALLKQLEESPTIRLYNKLKSKCECSEKMSKLIVNSMEKDMPPFNSSYSSKRETYLRVSADLDEMMFAILIMDEKAKAIEIECLSQTQNSLLVFSENTMPNVKAFAAMATSQLLQTLKQHGELSNDSIQQIITMNSQILAEELYSNEQTSVLSKMHKGMSTHYLELMEQNNRLINGYQGAGNNADEAASNDDGDNDQDAAQAMQTNGVNVSAMSFLSQSSSSSSSSSVQLPPIPNRGYLNCGI